MQSTSNFLYILSLNGFKTDELNTRSLSPDCTFLHLVLSMLWDHKKIPSCYCPGLKSMNRIARVSRDIYLLAIWYLNFLFIWTVRNLHQKETLSWSVFVFVILSVLIAWRRESFFLFVIDSILVFYHFLNDLSVQYWKIFFKKPI